MATQLTHAAYDTGLFHSYGKLLTFLRPNSLLSWPFTSSELFSLRIIAESFIGPHGNTGYSNPLWSTVLQGPDFPNSDIMVNRPPEEGQKTPPEVFVQTKFG